MSSDSTILQKSQERYKEKPTILLLSINSWKSSLEEEIHKINAYSSPSTTAKNNGWLNGQCQSQTKQSNYSEMEPINRSQDPKKVRMKWDGLQDHLLQLDLDDLYLSYINKSFISLLDYLLQESLFPKTTDYGVIRSMEFSLSVDSIVQEATLVNLPICQIKFSYSLLGIIFEISFIFDPFLIKIIEISIIKPTFHHKGIIIIHYPCPIELIIMPLTLIGYCSIGVVKSAISLHLIILPFPFIPASLFINELSMPISHPIFLISFISRPNIILLYHIPIHLLILLVLLYQLVSLYRIWRRRGYLLWNYYWLDWCFYLLVVYWCCSYYSDVTGK